MNHTNAITTQQDYNMICKAAAICNIGTKEVLKAFSIFKDNFLFTLRACGKTLIDKTRDLYIRKAFSLVIVRGGAIDQDNVDYWSRAQWKTYLNTANDNVCNFLYDHYRAQESKKDQNFKRRWSSIPPACYIKDLFEIKPEDWTPQAAHEADQAVDSQFIIMVLNKNPKDFFDREPVEIIPNSPTATHITAQEPVVIDLV